MRSRSASRPRLAGASPAVLPRVRRTPGQWWQRHRRWLLAGLVFVSVLAGLRALAPDGGATHEVLAPVRALPAGHTITKADLATVRLSGASDVAEADERQLVGQVLVLAWPAGVPLHRTAFTHADVTRDLAKGQVAVGLQPGRDSPIGFIRPGDLVDVIVSAEGRSSGAETVADSVRVLAVSAGTGEDRSQDGWLSGDDQEDVIVVSVPRSLAAEVSSAPRRGALSLVVSG